MGRRRAWGVWVLVAASAAPAHADEGIARRLAALKALVRPGAAPAVCARDAREPGLRARIERAVRDASLRFAVDHGLIHAVIRHESGYDPNAVSHKGAMGLMQLMPATARGLGVVCAFDPRENVLGGTRYLRRMRDRLGSWPRALAAYHAGPERVETGRVPRETRAYVARVMGSWRPDVRVELD